MNYCCIQAQYTGKSRHKCRRQSSRSSRTWLFTTSKPFFARTSTRQSLLEPGGAENTLTMKAYSGWYTQIRMVHQVNHTRSGMRIYHASKLFWPVRTFHLRSTRLYGDLIHDMTFWKKQMHAASEYLHSFSIQLSWAYAVLEQESSAIPWNPTLPLLLTGFKKRIVRTVPHLTFWNRMTDGNRKPVRKAFICNYPFNIPKPLEVCNLSFKSINYTSIGLFL